MQFWSPRPAKQGLSTSHACAGTCGPDGPSSPYFQLLQEGAQNRGEYVEVWPADVVAYPLSFDAAKAAGLYPVR